jgi:hypothetical protein
MMKPFQAMIEAAVRHAKAERSLLWADELAERIAASTPLDVAPADIAEALVREAARRGVAVTVPAGPKCEAGLCEAAG